MNKVENTQKGILYLSPYIQHRFSKSRDDRTIQFVRLFSGLTEERAHLLERIRSDRRTRSHWRPARTEWSVRGPPAPRAAHTYTRRRRVVVAGTTMCHHLYPASLSVPAIPAAWASPAESSVRRLTEYERLVRPTWTWVYSIWVLLLLA